MERIAAIVEGHLEAHFMKATYSNVLVQRPFPNGDNVSQRKIVEAINDQLGTLDASILRVVILLDRERRRMEAQELALAIKKGIAAKHPNRSYYIGVADREAENWILADSEMIKAKYRQKSYAYCGDGVEGKSRLGKITKVNLAPRDKALLLKEVSPARAKSFSPSLAHFVDQIDFSWNWAAS